MQVTLSYVISANGKITDGEHGDNQVWSSDEDAVQFTELRDAADVTITDRVTYQQLQLVPRPGKLRIIYTSTPEQFVAETILGQQEFTDEPADVLLKRLASEGYEHVLLAGGSRVSTDFLTAQLIDTVYLAFEPVLFGSGQPMLRDYLPMTRLRLESVRQLNEQGTILARYNVVR